MSASDVQTHPESGNGNGATSSLPDLTVLLVTIDHFDSLARTIARMRAQTIKDRIEIVVVAPRSASVKLDAATLSDFWGYQLVKVDSVHVIAWAYAAGARKARFPSWRT